MFKGKATRRVDAIQRELDKMPDKPHDNPRTAAKANRLVNDLRQANARRGRR